MIGPHIINDVANLDLLKQWQPPLITLLDPNPTYVIKVRQVCPKSKILIRVYVPDNEVADGIKTDPIKYAEFANQLVVTKYTSVFPQTDYFQVANEVLQSTPELEKLVVFETERMKFADKHGYKCGIFAFSVGNPDLPTWTTVLSPALDYASKNGHVVVVHQYSKPPSMWTPDPDWHIHRLEHKVVPLISGKYPLLRFVVAEYGLDDLLYGNGVRGGWQKFISADEYVKQLIDIGKYIHKFSNQVLGYSVFTLGTGSSDWVTYDIRGEVEQKLAVYYRDNPVTPLWMNGNSDGSKTMETVRVIASAGLNLRRTADTNAEVIRVVPFNAVIGVEPINNEWARFENGFISRRYLTNDLVIPKSGIDEFATAHGIDRNLLQALINVESGGTAFVGGRLLIRCEAHLLIQWHPPFSQFFSVDPTNRFLVHYYNGQKYHGNQTLEWAAFDFARSRNAEVAYRSTSYGMFQILGDNYAKLGFPTAEALFNYLNQSEDNQVDVFLRYLEKFNMISSLQTKNIEAVTASYNGSGNVKHYSGLLRTEYNRLSNQTPIVVPVKEEPVTPDQYTELKTMITEDRAFVTNLSNAVTEISTKLVATINNINARLAVLEKNCTPVVVEPPPIVEPEPPQVLPQPDKFANISKTLKPYFETGVMKYTQGTTYKLLDVFSIANGSWDQSNHKFSIEQSYRDKYLKAVSDPKYISTGDHSITVVVVDKSGNRIGGEKVTFTSNGTPPLVVDRVTKDTSGYENLILFSGQNFSETTPGPWSVSVGDFSASGFGMYSNWHISTVLVVEKQ